MGMKRLLKKKNPPTAVFAGNLMGAVGALGALKEAGLKVHEEVSLIGLHDSPIAEVIDPPLTVVKMPLHEMGRRARYTDKRRVCLRGGRLLLSWKGPGGTASQDDGLL